LTSLPWQQGQTEGAGITTRSRGRCAGNGARTGLRRVKVVTVLSPALAAAAEASSAAAVSEGDGDRGQGEADAAAVVELREWLEADR